MSNNEKPSENYEVGYGKPPKRTQFQKGWSGNPNGRPKGALNFTTVFLRTLREKVSTTENGKKKIITKLEASLKQLVNKAASGDLRAFSEVKAMAISVEQSANQDTTEQQEGLNELDQKAVLNILKRYNTTAGGSTEDEKGPE